MTIQLETFSNFALKAGSFSKEEKAISLHPDGRSLICCKKATLPKSLEYLIGKERKALKSQQHSFSGPSSCYGYRLLNRVVSCVELSSVQEPRVERALGQMRAKLAFTELLHKEHQKGAKRILDILFSEDPTAPLSLDLIRKSFDMLKETCKEPHL